MDKWKRYNLMVLQYQILVKWELEYAGKSIWIVVLVVIFMFDEINSFLMDFWSLVLYFGVIHTLFAIFRLLFSLDSSNTDFNVFYSQVTSGIELYINIFIPIPFSLNLESSSFYLDWISVGIIFVSAVITFYLYSNSNWKGQSHWIKREIITSYFEFAPAL